MWPFDIFAKRRAAEEAKRQAEHAAHMDAVKASIDAENRRQLARATAIDQAKVYRSTTAMNAQRQSTRPVAVGSTSSGWPARGSSSTSSSPSDDLLNPLNPLSPLSPINQAIYSAPADESRHSAPSHCANSSSHCDTSSSDYGSSSHSHSSNDHSCSSSSYDSGSSSSYDSGSSSSSSDW